MSRRCGAGRVSDLATAPGRLVGALRRPGLAGAPPLAVVPCDNLPDNGRRRPGCRHRDRPGRRRRRPRRLAGRRRLGRHDGRPDHPGDDRRRRRRRATDRRVRRRRAGRHRAVHRVGARRRLSREEAGLGDDRGARSSTTWRRTSAGSCGCSTAGTACSPTWAGREDTPRSPTPSPTRSAGRCSSSGGTRPRPALTGLPDGDVPDYRAALLQRFTNPRHPPPARPDRGRRLAEAARPGPARRCGPPAPRAGSRRPP